MKENLFTALRIIVKERKLGNRVSLMFSACSWFRVEYTRNAKKMEYAGFGKIIKAY